MSIYNDPSIPPQKPEQTFSAEPFQPGQPFSPPNSPQKKSGCGCVGCLLGCLGVTLVLSIVGGIGIYFVVQKLPDWGRQAIASAVDESELSDDDKKMVMEQVDRLVDGFKQGRVDLQKLGTFAEDFVQSPLMDLLIAFGAKVQYIDKSGLSDEEKAEAEKTLHRVARGVIEEKITQDSLDVALNHISNELPNGGRQFKEEVTDTELRAFLAECKKLADEAMISEEEIKVDIGSELKKLVDKTLGEVPEVPPAVEVEMAPPPQAEAPLPPTAPTPEQNPPDASKSE